MKLLLANPNTTAAITDRMAGAARGIAAPGTEIVTATAAFGASVISTRTEMAIAEHASISLLATYAAGCDAAIIGASLDSGLRAAREMLHIPVVGITEAAVHIACLVGGRFGVIVGSKHSAVITGEMIGAYGLASRVAGMRWLETASQHILSDPDAFVASLIEHSLALVHHDQAEVIVLIGAVMAGMPARLQDQVPVPVLEGVSCAVPLAEGLVRLRLPKPGAGSYAALTQRRQTGIDPALQAMFKTDNP